MVYAVTTLEANIHIIEQEDIKLSQIRPEIAYAFKVLCVPHIQLINNF